MESPTVQNNILAFLKNFLAILVIFLVTAFLHYPLLLNAPLVLQFDEGIQASEIIRLMKGEAFFFYFDY